MQCSEPNQRIHIDLSGTLKTMPLDKKFILCKTDAFSKFAELIGIPDKSGPTISSRWLFRHGLPLEIASDNGKEFFIEKVNTLLKLMKFKKTNTRL